MSMSLRDQLLAAGLVSQKQVREAERQQQHQERAQHQSKQKRRPPGNQPQGSHKPGQGAPGPVAPGNAASVHGSPANPGPARPGPVNAGLVTGAAASAASRHAAAQSAKVARDLALNKKQQEKAEKKARAAQIKQLIEQNRVVRGETDERYNFVVDGRVRFIAANADVRRGVTSGALCIVRHDGVFDVVPAAIAQRIRERDARAVVDAAAGTTGDTPPVDDAYKDFAVPDDLMW
jgi:uncharacterized protein YaiL (DUF2058 family)